jgi:NAD+ synthase
MESPRKQGADALKLNVKIVEELLTRFLRDEIRNTGFSKAVIGLSGGVDSAVSAALATRALGKRNVLGVLLPYKTSNPHSTKDAILLAAKLGIRTVTVPISHMVDAYCDAHKIKDRMRRGNVMARMRMVILYDISASERALVVGTSNKTEIMLGYGTLFGDTACALNPIGDLYKTQVWQLASGLRIPDRIVKKAPSADLWKGQTDEGEMGLEYREVDRLLYFMIDERWPDDELVKRGFDRRVIRKVRSMVQKNQFKRRPPVIAKVSYRTVNVDFRYARDWGT